MAEYIHKGDIGLVITLTIQEDGAAVDISAATTKTIYITKPSGTLLTKTAAFVTDGTDGKIKHTTVSGDLSEEGVYTCQGYVAGVSGFTGHTTAFDFGVRGVISD